MRLSSWLLLPGQVLVCLLFCAYSCSGKDKNEEDLSQYFYKSSKEKHYVQEVTSKSDPHPDFIYSPSYPNGRVVTYYAHWCPHCIHFVPKYIEFSNKIHEMSQKFHATVETFAVSCVPQKKICKDNKIHGYPTMMFYPPNSINGTKMKYFDLHPNEIFQMAGVSAAAAAATATEIGDKNVVALPPPSRSDKHDKHDNISLKPHFMHRTNSETFHDAHLSFDFAMKTAVFTQTGPLPEKPKKALENFLFAMKKTMPITSSLQPVVRDLLTNFESIVTGPAGLNKIMAKHPPPKPINKWSPASSQHETGYTAGLWTLFHIMSVGLVQWNHLAMDDGQKLIPSEMADIQRNYVEHFFQCEECRLNFLSDFDACLYDRCNRLVTSAREGTLQQFIQYPLWLYETHNAVNVRLRKERIDENIEKEGFTTQAEVAWPPAKSCPSCWLSEEKNRWDELEVYKFLQQSYWLEDNDSEVLRKLGNSETGIKLESSMAGTLLSGVDGAEFDLCTYVCCFAFTIFIVWYRKRQYDQRGIHKKIESDIP